MEFDDVEYDRQLVQLLDLLKKVNLDQFTDDLLVNDRKTFHDLKEYLIRKGRIEFYDHTA